MTKHHFSVWSLLGVVVMAAGACGGAIQPPGESRPPTGVSPSRDAAADRAPGQDARPTPTSDPPRPEPDANTAAPDAAVVPVPPGGGGAADARVEVDAGASEDAAPAAADAMVGAPGPGARNLRISLVEVTQGTFISLGTPEMVLAPGARNAPLIEGRSLLVRVHTTPLAGFAARALRALVALEYADGTSARWDAMRMVSGASEPDKLETTFNLIIPAGAVKPGAKLVSTIHELGEATEGDPAPRFPGTGSADLAVVAGKMQLDLVILQVMGGPGGKLDDSAARRKRVEDYMFDVYPIQKLNITWRPPIAINRKLTGFNQVFGMLRDARNKDGAPDSAYYHMLLSPGDINQGGGVGYLAGPEADDAASRISITVLRNQNVDSMLDYISHEVGHNHGRDRAPGCNAGEPDPRFPHPGGGVGANGFSLSTGALFPRARHKDLMGYCAPTWVSDYTWRAFEKRVRITSGYSRGNVALVERSLQGFVAPGEAPSWGLVTGRLVAEGTAITSNRRAVVHLRGGGSVVVPVDVRHATAGRSRQVAVALPVEGDFERVEALVDGERFDLSAGALSGP